MLFEVPMSQDYIIEMLHITKLFPGIVANDDITLQLKKGEIHALLGENGAGKSTLMSVLFGLYQAEKGEIRKNGKKVVIRNPNDATALHIGMVHQHFKLVEVFTVLDNIILGREPMKGGLVDRAKARKDIAALCNVYGMQIDPDAKIEDITVGMQQRVEILKMLYRDNEILIFDEPTAVLTPQEITELMETMKMLAAQGKSILFITHKLNEIMSVADRCTVLRKGKYIGTVNIKDTSPEELSRMMVGRDVNFTVDKAPSKPGKTVLKVEHMSVPSKIHQNLAVKDVSFEVRSGEIVTIAGIDGNGQSELIYGITGIDRLADNGPNADKMRLTLDGNDITKKSIREKSIGGMSHIPEDRQKYGLVLRYNLEQNLELQRYWEDTFQNHQFIKNDAVTKYADRLIGEFDVRSGQGTKTMVGAMSGGNQQKAIIARELDKKHSLLIAVQPIRGLDVGAIEYIHKQIIADRDKGAGILLVSYELDEVMNLSDRILVMFEGRIVGELDPKKTTVEELGLYMSGAKRQEEAK